jgi:hypothetical protein
MASISRAVQAALIVAAAGGVAGGVAACGGGAPADPLASMSANQIMTKTLADLKAASSVQYSGNASDSGQEISLDLAIAKSGACRGTMSEPGTGSIKIVTLGQTMWLQMSAKFWASEGMTNSAEANMLAGKYISVPENSSGMSAFSGLCSLSGLAGNFKGKGTLKKEAESTIDGQKVLGIEDSANNAVAYVTDTATPELVRVTGSGSDKGDILNFTGYGATEQITAPPSSDVIDGSKLGL